MLGLKVGLDKSIMSLGLTRSIRVQLTAVSKEIINTQEECLQLNLTYLTYSNSICDQWGVLRELQEKGFNNVLKRYKLC